MEQKMENCGMFEVERFACFKVLNSKQTKSLFECFKVLKIQSNCCS